MTGHRVVYFLLLLTVLFSAGAERQQSVGFPGDPVGEMSQPDLPQPEWEQDQGAEHRGGAGQSLNTRHF